MFEAAVDDGAEAFRFENEIFETGGVDSYVVSPNALVGEMVEYGRCDRESKMDLVGFCSKVTKYAMKRGVCSMERCLGWEVAFREKVHCKYENHEFNSHLQPLFMTGTVQEMENGYRNKTQNFP